MCIKNLHGKRVLVTGAGSGIGRATALAFAREGAQMVLSDLDEASLHSVRDAIVSAGGRCSTHSVDVRDEAAMQRLAEAVHQDGGAIDVLVYNAGIGYLGAFLDSPVDSWDRTLHTNVMGVVHGLRSFLPAMHEAGGFRWVVNVASLAGFAPAPNMSAYAASKSAVIGLSESVSLELRLCESQVGMTVVCPGIIDTAITRNTRNVAPGIGAQQLARLQAFYAAKGAPAEVVADAITRAACNTAFARLESGTRCSLPAFMRSAGSVHCDRCASSRLLNFKSTEHHRPLLPWVEEVLD
ncbi:SDR family NAD(P)-dependent oxidoreductase [Variovorax soli]|uniref:SDR family NAD(P)-dependent oxidoreductase n=1 Tax=Variovorax soli TaxID=376815 RepID=UPI0008388CC1|nr:SDR family NAD(P)-dependent oxidoreductase [Variovorax soli]